MKNYLLLAIVGLLLSSCSSRYGHIPKVRKHKKIVKVKKHKPTKKQIKEVYALGNKKPSVSSEVNPSITRTEATTSNRVRNKTLSSNTDAYKSINQKTLDGDINTTIGSRSLKKITSAPQNESAENAQQERSRSWLYYIVVGLIFLLLAALIVWPFGWIFYIVGLIAIFVGLLALIGLV